MRQLVEQKSAGEPFLWKAVCPLMRLFLQWEQDMCKEDKGLMMGSVCVSVAGVTEKTDPILKSSCQQQNDEAEVSGGPVILDPSNSDMSAIILFYYTFRIYTIMSEIMGNICKSGTRHQQMFPLNGESTVH